METFGYPQRRASQTTGRVGETFIEHFITKDLGWIFRPVHREDDYGIDGYIDVVQAHNVTGKGLAVQIKCGDSYLAKRTAGGFRYDGSNKHLNFYLNLGVPVVLVLLSGDCREAYWVKFDLARTEETASGWWIEVPKENLLNSQIADTWASIAGPIQDYSEQIQSFWAFGKVVRSADFLLIAIPKSDVAEKSMYTINTVLERLQSNKELLLKKRGAVEIFFPDWDDDPREIYEIPEIRGWMSASFEAGIPWFYFLNSQFPFHSLKIILACGCSVSSLETAVGGYMLSTEAEDRSRWLEANFHNLNCFTESNSIDVLINKELCEGVMSALFGMPPIGDVVDP